MDGRSLDSERLCSAGSLIHISVLMPFRDTHNTLTYLLARFVGALGVQRGWDEGGRGRCC